MAQKQRPLALHHRRPSNGNGAQVLNAPSAGLGDLEKISIRALLAYVAMKIGKPEEEIQQCLSVKFAAANIDQLPSRFYEDVIEFLVNLCDRNEEPVQRGGP